MGHEILKSAVGRALAEARQRTQGPRGRHLSQDAIAKRLDVVTSTVGDWERGAGGLPPDEIIAAWAELAGETYGTIMDRVAAIIREDSEPREDPSSD